jgi:hypothetical protein
MTIDERLEALAQRLELMAHMQQDNERKTAEHFAVMTQKVAVMTEKFAVMTEKVNALTDAMTVNSGIVLRLERHVESYEERQERRMDDHHERLDRIERNIEALTAAQLVSEKLLQAFLEHGGNGQSKPRNPDAN